MAHYTVNDACVRLPSPQATVDQPRPCLCARGVSTALAPTSSGSGYRRVQGGSGADAAVGRWQALWTRQYVEMFALLQSIGAQLACTGERLWTLAKQSVTSRPRAPRAAHLFFSSVAASARGTEPVGPEPKLIARFTGAFVPPFSRSRLEKQSLTLLRGCRGPRFADDRAYAKPTPVSRQRCDTKKRQVETFACGRCPMSDKQFSLTRRLVGLLAWRQRTYECRSSACSM